MSELGPIEKVDAFLRDKDDISEICRLFTKRCVSIVLVRSDEVGHGESELCEGKTSVQRSFHL